MASTASDPETKPPESEYPTPATAAAQRTHQQNPFTRFYLWTDDKIWRLLPKSHYARLRRTTFFLLLSSLVLLCLLLVIILPPAIILGSKAHKKLALPTGNGTFVGDGTYYGTGLGACGITSKDSDMIVAIAHTLFDAMGASAGGGGDPNQNPACGRFIVAGLESGKGEAVRVKVVDRCTGCAPTDLDFSPTAFQKLADIGLGRIRIRWKWDT